MESLRLIVFDWVGHPLLASVLLLLGLCLVAFGVSLAFALLMVVAVTRWLTPFDDERDRRFDAGIRRLRAPLRLLGFGGMLQVLAPRLSVAWHDEVAHLGLVLSILAGGWCVYRGLRTLEAFAVNQIELDAENNLIARQRLTQFRALRNIAGFATGVITLAFVLITFERVRELGAGLLASAGVAGVVLGFAAQKTMANVVAGIQIALSQPIRVDDVVIVEGEWGRIEEITLTFVVVRIWDLRRLIVPVSYFIEKPFQNWTHTSADLLGTVELHLDYSVSVDALREEAKAVLEAAPEWDRKVWNVQVTAANERAMVVRVLFSAASSGVLWELRCRVREQLLRFVQQNHPGGLPRIRADVQPASAISDA